MCHLDIFSRQPKGGAAAKFTFFSPHLSVNNLVVSYSILNEIKLSGTHDLRMNLGGSSGATCSLVLTLLSFIVFYKFSGSPDARLSFHSRGTLMLLCFHPLLKILSSPAAIWPAADPHSRQYRLRLPWLQLPELAFGPSCSTLKWKEWLLSSIPSTTLAGRTGGQE